MINNDSTFRFYSKRSARRLPRVRQNRGFTIVEVLIAIVIFSIGLLGMAAMQTNAMGTNKSAQKISNATEKAVGVMEELIALPFTHSNLDNGKKTPAKDSDWIDNNDDGEIDEAGETGDYTVAWTVVDENDPYITNITTDTKLVSVTVSSDVTNKTVTVSSLISLKE